MNKRRPLTAVFLSVLFLFEGCARFEPVPMPISNPEDYSAVVSRDDIEVRAMPYSREEIQKYFAADLPKKNVWPVKVYVKNNSQKTYLFAKGLVEPNRITSHEASRKGRRKAGWRLAWGLIFFSTFFGIPIAIPLFVTGCQALGANNYMTRKYAEWEILDMKIQPGKDFSGIMFFLSPSQPSDFSLTLLEEGSDVSLQIPIHV